MLRGVAFAVLIVSARGFGHLPASDAAEEDPEERSALRATNQVTAEEVALFREGAAPLDMALLEEFTDSEFNFEFPEEGKIFRVLTSNGGNDGYYGSALAYYLHQGCSYADPAGATAYDIDRCDDPVPAAIRLETGD